MNVIENARNVIETARHVIETARLDLRKLDPRDAPFMLKLLNQESFLRHIGDKGVRTLADACDYISTGPADSYRRFGFGLYLTSLRASGEPIGICGLVKRATLADVDVGFAFLPQHAAQGYATEAAAAVLAYGRRTLGLNRIVAVTAPDNHRSMAVLEKIGLQFQGKMQLVKDGPEVNLFGPGPGPEPPGPRTSPV